MNGLKRAAISAALFLFFTVNAVAAQDVTLRSRDGAIELSGTMLGFYGGYGRGAGYRADLARWQR